MIKQIKIYQTLQLIKQIQILKTLQMIMKQIKTQHNLILHKIQQMMEIKHYKLIIKHLLIKQIIIQILQIKMIKQ